MTDDCMDRMANVQSRIVDPHGDVYRLYTYSSLRNKCTLRRLKLVICSLSILHALTALFLNLCLSFTLLTTACISGTAAAATAAETHQTRSCARECAPCEPERIHRRHGLVLSAFV